MKLAQPLMVASMVLPGMAQAGDPRLATVEECAQIERPKEATCISNISDAVQFYDGLSWITNNQPAGSGFQGHRHGGVDRVDGPEDHDGRISSDEWAIPVAFINEPWQTATCDVDKLGRAIDAAIARGEVSREWGEEQKVQSLALAAQGAEINYCMTAIVVDIVLGQLRMRFELLDINKDGAITQEDDLTGDQKITKEDASSPIDSK